MDAGEDRHGGAGIGGADLQDVTAASPVAAAPADVPLRPGPIVPEWLANLAALGWRVVAITAFIVAVWLLCTVLWTVTASIAVATVVSALFAPWMLRLARQGRSRTAAAAIVWGLAMLSVGAVVLLLAWTFLPYVVEVASRINEALAALEAELAALGLPDAFVAVVHRLVQAITGLGGDAASSATSSVGATATVLVLSTFLVFFFLRDGDRAWRWMLQGFTDEKQARMTTSGSEALARVGGYLRGTAVLSALIALTDLVFMALLGVPLAVPLAVLVFFAGFIPYFGGIVTTVLIVLVTWFALGPWSVAIFLVLVAIRNAILGYGVRPALYGRTTSLHPGLVLIALPAGYAIAGVIGLFVAVPVTAVILAVAGAVVAIVEPDERPPLPALIPAWLDRIAQWSWRLLVGFALVAVMIAIFLAVPTVVIPMVLALVLAATLEPVVKRLMRGGRSRAAAAGIAVGGGFLVVVGVIVLAIVSLVAQADRIAQGALDGATTANGALGGRIGPLLQLVAEGGGQTLSSIRSLIDGAATVAVIVILSVLLAFYLLRDGGRLWARVVARARPSVRSEVDAAGLRAFEVLGGYMFGTAMISLVASASQFVIMVVLGIDLALPVFVLSFFLCFIPYIGGFISTGIALLLTIALGSTTDVAIMAVWTLVFNIVTGNIVSPIVYGKTVHLHPAVVLVAIPAGSAIAGVLGMFFVVPAIGVVAVTWRSVLKVMASRSSSSPARGDGDGPPLEEPAVVATLPAAHPA